MTAADADVTAPAASTEPVPPIAEAAPLAASRAEPSSSAAQSAPSAASMPQRAYSATTTDKRPCGCGKVRAPHGRRPPTRPSCLECVEKHLGAAWVLITEHHNGYPHRLLAIGHLHEAEEESQAWPELHAAIRDARKAYQQTGAVPDFEPLAGLLQTAKSTTKSLFLSQGAANRR